MGKGILTVGKLVLTNTVSNQDAYDRLRVSNPITVYENLSTGTGAKNPLLIDEITAGSGVATANDNSYIAMAAPTSGGRVVRQSKPYIVYKPGTSKITLCTGVFNDNGGTVGLRSRIGPFDDVDDQVTNPQGGDGYFFELEGTTMGIVYRTASSGAQIDTRIVQSDWNFDTFDGSGPSRITITTWDDAFLLIFDQQWLGVGQVRIGLIIEGIIYYAHIFTNGGLKFPYTRTAKLPIRYEIENVSAGASVDEMRMMCQSSLMEAQPSSLYPQFVWNASQPIPVGTDVAVLSLRLKSTSNRVTLRLVDIAVLASAGGGDPAPVNVILNPTLGGATYANDPSPDSAAELDTASTTAITDGTTVACGWMHPLGALIRLSLTGGGNRSPWLDINSNIAGTSDILTIAVTRQVVSSSIGICLTWIEIS